MPARGSAEWKGDLRSGTGTFTAGDTISGEYSFKSRFEDGPGANPEQLIAAAHASCFSMALSNMLAEAGTPPESVRTDATVTLRPVDGAPTITKIALVTVGRVPGIDDEAFQRHAAAAKAGLPGQPGAGSRSRDHPRGNAGRLSPPAPGASRTRASVGPGWRLSMINSTSMRSIPQVHIRTNPDGTLAYRTECRNTGQSLRLRCQATILAGMAASAEATPASAPAERAGTSAKAETAAAGVTVQPLTAAEEAAWRALARALVVLPRVLDADLLESHGLNLAEYIVLMSLSEQPDHTLRMNELASFAALSASGLTRVIDRLERQRLVERVRARSDGRGQLAVLTDAGLERLMKAYPSHLLSVRRHVMDHLGGLDLEAFATAMGNVAAGEPGPPLRPRRAVPR